MAEVAAVGGHGGDTRSAKVKADQVGNTKSVSDDGTTATYILRRLKRDDLERIAQPLLQPAAVPPEQLEKLVVSEVRKS